MKFDALDNFQTMVARIKMPRINPPWHFSVDFDWEDSDWWHGQGVYDDIDRFAVITRHISELRKIIYHSVCFPGKILNGYCADVTLCSPHIVPLTAIMLLLHQAEQEWRALLRKINAPHLSKVFNAWRFTHLKAWQ